MSRSSSPRSGPVQLALNAARHGVYVTPAVVGLAWAVRGGEGAAAAAIALSIVLVNLFASAASLTWAGRQGPNVLMSVALGGFLVRMGVVVGVLLAVRHVVDMPTLAVTVVISQLGLLLWESRTLSPLVFDAGPRPRRPTLEGRG